MTVLNKKKNIKWDDLSARQSVLIYTLAFGLLSAVLFSFFMIQKRGFIWYDDGLAQHYPALRYIGVWGRETLANIFHGNFNVQNFNFSIGYGADVFTTLHYYGFTDPLNWLSVLVPSEYTYWLYNFLVLLRFYISGIGFIFYCRTMKQTGIPAVASSFIYVFSGYALFAGIRHPFFLTPMVYLPLILIGCEKILKGKNPILFIVSVSLCVISNFYFAYMAIIMTIIYVFIRCFVSRELKLKKAVITIGKFLVFGIISLMISAFIFLPIVIVFMGNNRSEITKAIPLFYDLEYYQTIVISFMGLKNAGSWNLPGYTSLGLLSVFYIFICKGRYRQLKAAAVIALVLQLFPILGSVLNGFDYVSNRYIWAVAFLIAFISTYTFKDIISASKKEKIKLLVISSVYLLLLIILRNGRTFPANINVTVLMVMVVFMLAADKLFKQNARNACAVVGVMAVFASIINNGVNLYALKYMGYVNDFIPNSVSAQVLDVNEGSLFQEKLANSENSFQRYEVKSNKLSRLNSSLFNGTAGTSYYFSLSDTFVVPSFYNVELPFYSSATYYSANQQTFLNTLSSVKYLVLNNDRGVPPGYTLVDRKEGYYPFEDETRDHLLYENQNALPIGYTYDSYITKADFEKLSSVERQEAMMQGVLLENSLSGFDVSEPELTSETLPYTLVLSKGVSATDSGVYTEVEDAVLKIRFTGKADCETYIRFKNLNVVDFEDKRDGKYFYISQRPVNSFYPIIVQSNQAGRTIHFRTADNQFYSGLHDFTVNIGYSQKPFTECTVILPSPGYYSWDDIEVISQPMDNYGKCVNALKEDVLQNIEIKTDRVSGTVELDENKILCLSIPYSKGWTAYVDGEKAELLRANGWCMAIPLDKGEHTITLVYETPGMKLGFVISFLGVAFAAAVGIYYMRKSKKIKMA